VRNEVASQDDAPAVDAFLRASRVLVSIAARSLAGVTDKVTLPQYRALVVLAGRGPQNAGALAEILGVPDLAEQLLVGLAGELRDAQAQAAAIAPG
jgi:hypothetical protein